MKRMNWRVGALLVALVPWLQPASAADAAASGDVQFASMVSPKTLSMLKDSQVRTLQTALSLQVIPAPPEEFGRMLTIAAQFARSDPQAQAALQALSAENAKWLALSAGNPPPVDLQTFYALRTWPTYFPVYSKMADLTGKPTPFEQVTRTTDTWLHSPFTVQAFRVRQLYVDLLAQERPKAERNVPGARDVLAALLAHGASAALEQVDKPAPGDARLPSCDEVLWLPALPTEAGARKAKDGWERPEVPCR